MRKKVRTYANPGSEAARAPASPTRCAVSSTTRSRPASSASSSRARLSAARAASADAAARQLRMDVAVGENARRCDRDVRDARDPPVELAEPRVALEIDPLPLLPQLRLGPVGVAADRLVAGLHEREHLVEVGRGSGRHDHAAHRRSVCAPHGWVRAPVLLTDGRPHLLPADWPRRGARSGPRGSRRRRDVRDRAAVLGRRSTPRRSPRGGSSPSATATSSAGPPSRRRRAGPATRAWSRTASTSPRRARARRRPALLTRSSPTLPRARASGRSRRASSRERRQPRAARAAGFRIVGRRERIAQLDGVWRDTLFLELRLPDSWRRPADASVRVVPAAEDEAGVVPAEAERVRDADLDLLVRAPRSGCSRGRTRVGRRLVDRRRQDAALRARGS